MASGGRSYVLPPTFETTWLLADIAVTHSCTTQLRVGVEIFWYQYELCYVKADAFIFEKTFKHSPKASKHQVHTALIAYFQQILTFQDNVEHRLTSAIHRKKTRRFRT